MALDNYTRSIFGWKIEGRENVHKFQTKLEKENKNDYDDYCDFLVEDTMCGEYIYFGAHLVKYDADEGGEFILNQQVIKEATDEYYNFLKEHPELDKFLKKQIGKLTTSKEPQLFIFQQIW